MGCKSILLFFLMCVSLYICLIFFCPHLSTYLSNSGVSGSITFALISFAAAASVLIFCLFLLPIYTYIHLISFVFPFISLSLCDSILTIVSRLFFSEIFSFTSSSFRVSCHSTARGDDESADWQRALPVALWPFSLVFPSVLLPFRSCASHRVSETLWLTAFPTSAPTPSAVSKTRRDVSKEKEVWLLLPSVVARALMPHVDWIELKIPPSLF